VTWPERSVMPDSGRRSVYLADLLREITPKSRQLAPSTLIRIFVELRGRG
jgi:hypothetical protein